MKESIFEAEGFSKFPAADVFRWHERPGAFERLNPPWNPAHVLERSGGIRDGARVKLAVTRIPFVPAMELEHFGYEEGKRFCDRQVHGPFPLWEHTHEFSPHTIEGSILKDTIRFAPPLPSLTRGFGAWRLTRELERVFRYRHTVTWQDLELHRRYGDIPRRVWITGASGLIGSALSALLSAGGHHVAQVVRAGRAASLSFLPSVRWNVPGNSFEGVDSAPDAVVHLAGASIFKVPWTKAHETRVRESRVEGTRSLVRAILALPTRPRVVVSGSATGYYGARGDEELTEESPAGSGFLPEVCREWEAATRPLEDAGIRVVHLRTGVVLTPMGGALRTMLPAFRCGVGGRLGDGRQFGSYISLDDIIGLIYHALATDSVRGALNGVCPLPMSNAEFTRLLGELLARPTPIPVPAGILGTALGRFAQEGVLASVKAMPAKALATGYQFLHPEPRVIFRHVLGI